MKVATSQEMKEIDNAAINELGIPGVVLMENAALKVVNEVSVTIGILCGKNIYIFAGKGNNGGDAFAAARHLYNNGAVVKVYIVHGRNGITGDALLNLDILDKMGIAAVELSEQEQLNQLETGLGYADVIIDGIFGTGLRGAVEGFTANVINIINKSGKKVIAIDIPSGVNGSTGEVCGACVRADRTVTFTMPKVGLVVHPGRDFAGEIIVEDIGIPSRIMGKMDIKLNVLEKRQIASLIPVRSRQSNKGDWGRILIVTGSTGMTGAGQLSARAAFRSGAGLVYLAVPQSLMSIYETAVTEAITVPLEDNNTGYLSQNCIGELLKRFEVMDAAAIGPGLTVKYQIKKIIRSIIENSSIPLVLDADALNSISEDASILKKLGTEAVLTPHPGEMARLAGISIKDVQNNRIGIAREFACRWNVIIVLKGAGTVVAIPDGTTYINQTGNSGMATAGTGDVLTGVIAGLIGQGLKPADAAVAGVYIHGLAGDDAAALKGEHGLIASDIVEKLPYVIKKLSNVKS